MIKIFLFATFVSFTLLATSCMSPEDKAKREETRLDDSVATADSISLGNLEIAQNDFPKQLNWADANKACADLGAGWRLPNIDEMFLIFKYKDKLGIEGDHYWFASKDTLADFPHALLYNVPRQWTMKFFGDEYYVWKAEARLKGTPWKKNIYSITDLTGEMSWEAKVRAVKNK